jgi:hypothetical protein
MRQERANISFIDKLCLIAGFDLFFIYQHCSISLESQGVTAAKHFLRPFQALLWVEIFIFFFSHALNADLGPLKLNTVSNRVFTISEKQAKAENPYFHNRIANIFNNQSVLI